MKIRIYVKTRFIGSKDQREIDIDNDLGIDLIEWEGMLPQQKDEAVKMYIDDQQMFQWGYEVVK